MGLVGVELVFVRQARFVVREGRVCLSLSSTGLAKQEGGCAVVS